MPSSCCFVVRSLLWFLLVGLLSSDDNHKLFANAANRVIPSPLTVVMYPVSEVTDALKYTWVRDHIEDLLGGYLTTEHDWPNGTNVTYVGMFGNLGVRFQKASARVTMDPVVYFTDSSSDLPGKDDMDSLLQQALPPEVLLEALRPDFPNLTMVALLDDWTDPPTTTPTSMPTTAPTTGLTTPPSVSPAIIVLTPPTPTTSPSASENQVFPGVVKEPPRLPESSDSRNLTFGIMGGGIAFIVAVALLSMRWKRSRITLRSGSLGGGDSSKDPTEEWEEEIYPHTPSRYPSRTGSKPNKPSPTKTVRLEDDEEDEEQASTPSSSSKANLLSPSYGNWFPASWMPQSNSNSNSNSQQMRDVDDILSDLEFQTDASGDFDDTVSIQPKIIAVQPVESFEVARASGRILKKDMLDNSHTTPNPYWKIFAHDGDKTAPNVLKPTDVSAATLAVQPRTSSSPSPSPQSPSSSRKNVSWWGSARMYSKSSSSSLSSPKTSTRHANHHKYESQSEDNFSGGDWDPDDHSITTDGSEKFDPKVENKDEQSLLNYSLRNESYKMQRLRTPERIERRMRLDEVISTSSEEDYHTDSVFL